jgi:hypothetical protein
MRRNAIHKDVKVDTHTQCRKRYETITALETVSFSCVRPFNVPLICSFRGSSALPKALD